MDHVVTAFVRHRGRILLLRRSDRVGTYRGRWGGISGFVEGDPEMTRPDAERELDEEVGVTSPDVVRGGEPLHVVDDEHEREWVVHPYLVAVDDPAVEPNEEIAASEWVSPTAILERDCVPALWETYRRVSPTLEDVAGDETHGSAAVSARALEVLRDAAAEAAHADSIDEPEFRSWGAVADLARDLRDARPAMAAVPNRVNRAMARADGPASLAAAAQSVLEAALDADDEAAAVAADLLADAAEEGGTDAGDGPRVVTLSRSGTALAAIRRAEPAVVVGESRPGDEGVEVAEELADDGLDVTLVADSALAAVVAGDVGGVVGDGDGDENRDGNGGGDGNGNRDGDGHGDRDGDGHGDRDGVRDRHGNDDPADPPDLALVGADTVLAYGDVVNKVGTRGLGLACRREAVPLYVVAARDKVAPDDDFVTEAADPETVYDGVAPLDVLAPLFDRTPADCVVGVVTEDGVLDTEGVREVAAEHREHARWDA